MRKMVGHIDMYLLKNRKGPSIYYVSQRTGPRQMDWVGNDKIMASFADIQSCIYADFALMCSGLVGQKMSQIMLT